jgi:hypothetical protein
MADLWYYAQNGQQLGPVPSTQLQQLAAQGHLQPADLIWKEGMPSWVAASSVQGLFQQQPPAPHIPAGPMDRDRYAGAPEDDWDRPVRPRRRRQAGGMSTGAKVAIFGGIGGLLLVVVVVVLIVILRGAGPRFGPGSFTETVPPGQSRFVNIKFNGGVMAEIIISGQGNADVEIYVYDSANREVTSNWIGVSDQRRVNWVPPSTQTYRVELRSNGPGTNRVLVKHN